MQLNEKHGHKLNPLFIRSRAKCGNKYVTVFLYMYVCRLKHDEKLIKLINGNNIFFRDGILFICIFLRVEIF